MNDNPNIPNLDSDPLMASLRRANPVAASDAPSAQSEAAKSLLAEITQQPAGETFEPFQRTEAKPVKSGSTNAGRYRYLAAVAAAIAVVAASVSFLVPRGSEPALAVVQTAAAETEAISSGRILIEVELSATEGVESEEFAAGANITYDGDNYAIKTDFLEGEGTEEILGDGESLEARLVDDVIYVNAEGEWMGFDAGPLGTELFGSIADPISILDEVQTLTEATKIGDATIDGVETTHYQSTIDLAEENSFDASGWLGQFANEAALAADGTVVIDFYISNDNQLIRQLDVTADLEPPAEEQLDEAATITLTTIFSDLGEDITIEAPEGVTVESFGDSLGD